MVVYSYKKGTQTMKNIITTIAMFILTIGTQAQSVYKFDKFYNYKHNSLLVSPFAVNNDEDSSLGSGVSKCKMTIYSDKIVIKNKKMKQTFEYTIDSVENVFGNDYVVYYTKNKGLGDQEFTFYLIKDGNQTFIYESWIVEPYVKQGWLAVSK